MCLKMELFFYQAEDSIRDYKVTGVQTCALPISVTMKQAWSSSSPTPGHCSCRNWSSPKSPISSKAASAGWQKCGSRSEERRVGKEYISGFTPDSETCNIR